MVPKVFFFFLLISSLNNVLYAVNMLLPLKEKSRVADVMVFEGQNRQYRISPLVRSSCRCSISSMPETSTDEVSAFLPKTDLPLTFDVLSINVTYFTCCFHFSNKVLMPSLSIVSQF